MASEHQAATSARQQHTGSLGSFLGSWCRVLLDVEGNEIHLGTGGFGCVILGARNGVQVRALPAAVPLHSSVFGNSLSSVEGSIGQMAEVYVKAGQYAST